jgi:hypothetical protein
MENELALKNYITEADKKFFYHDLMNYLKAYSEAYQISFEKKTVEYLTSDEYLYSEVLVDDELPKIVFGISGVEPLENWLFKDVSYIRRANELRKLLDEGKKSIEELITKRDNGEVIDQNMLDDLSKKQAQYNLELNTLEIDNTFFRRHKIFEKIDMALVYALTPHAENNETLKEIVRLINNHLKERSAYMREEKRLQDNYYAALAQENPTSIKLSIDEIDNRRTFRRKNMLTVGTCTLVKTNQ